MQKISKADLYFIEVLREVKLKGQWDENPRPKWSNGDPAYSKFITQKSFNYRIDKGEFPVTTIRPTAIKGGWYDIEAIYQKQTNFIEEMHPSIRPWWEGFAHIDENTPFRSIGKTYGHTVARYDLMNKLLSGLKNNPFGRRHIINLWQEQQMIDDPKALVPCAYETLWSATKGEVGVNEIFIDLTLNQRSQDFIVTSSLNPLQYVMFGMAVCSSLTNSTGTAYILRNFKYNIQNLHIYDRHLFAIDELLNRKITKGEFKIELPVIKDFYDIRIEDFIIEKPDFIQPLSKKLEIAV